MLGVGLVSMFDSDATFSATEKRALKAKPKLSLSALLDGSYSGNLSEYYADTFPMRETLMKTNRSLNNFYYFSALSGKDAPQVVINANNNTAAGGEALSDHQKPSTEKPNESGSSQQEEPTEPTENDAPAEQLGAVLLVGNRALEVPYANHDNIERYAKAVDAIDKALGSSVRTFNIAVPNAAEFYAPSAYRTSSTSQKDMIDFCYSKAGKNVITVDAYSKIAPHTDEYIYFRTDHHWTQLGAYYAYTAFCESAGLKAVNLREFETGTYENFVGAMYTFASEYPQSQILVDEPDTVYFYRPTVETHAKYYSDATLSDPITIGVISNVSEGISNKYLCFIGGDTPICIIETDVDGPVCMLIKESYGNAFAPFLTQHYSKVIVVDPREFNRDGKPSLDLAAFAKEQGVNDCIILNYPMVYNATGYTKWLERLVEQ
jgi:hypothetical protein